MAPTPMAPATAVGMAAPAVLVLEAAAALLVDAALAALDASAVPVAEPVADGVDVGMREEMAVVGSAMAAVP